MKPPLAFRTAAACYVKGRTSFSHPLRAAAFTATSSTKPEDKQQFPTMDSSISRPTSQRRHGHHQDTTAGSSSDTATGPGNAPSDGNVTSATGTGLAREEAVETSTGTARGMRAPHMTQAELDEELRQKMEGIAGEGGAAGVEYEDGKPVAMKRGVRENMFRYI
ncbi:hypothetical protein VTK56DRAFT_5398 [Thermocarpiscus australiensis]